MIRRLLSTTLAAILAAGLAPAVLAQQQGVISGRAGDARKPYTNYAVRLVDVSNRQITGTVPLDPQGQFGFSGIEVDKQYLVQLFNVQENRIVCTEGPYPLIAPDQVSRTDVNIKCRKPVGLLLLTAVAAAGATAAVTKQSGSQ